MVVTSTRTQRLAAKLAAPILLWLGALPSGCACPPPPETPQTGQHPPAAHPPSGADAQGPQHSHQAPHQEHHQPLGHRFKDANQWTAHFDDPKRDAWQRPAELVSAMGLTPGMSVADLGTGTGYFVPHLAAAVGPAGQVLAIDIEPDMVRHVKGRAKLLGLTNVAPRLALVDDPLLADESVDRILVVNTWHHIPSREDYGRKLVRALKPGGSLWVVDYTMEADQGPPKDHRLAPEVVVGELSAAGLATKIDGALLSKQYVVTGTKEQR
jgi:cyclopropane fatty-acyl-phospholipid synthase-like methyltransferase